MTSPPPFLVSAPLNNNSSVFSIWKQQNTAVRFATSGLLGNAVFFGLDQMMFPRIVGVAVRLSVSNSSPIASGSKWMHKNAASVSFFVAYLLDIAVQHFLNAWLVFGLETISTTDLYLTSLVTTYTAYFGTLCGSTLLQAQLLRLGISHSRAFWTTIVLGSLVNYIVLTSLNAVAKNTSKGDRKQSANEQNIKMAMVPLWTARASRSDFLSNVLSTDSIISGRISNQLNERSHGEDQKWTI